MPMLWIMASICFEAPGSGRDIEEKEEREEGGKGEQIKNSLS